jgi:hypothetical protein
VAHGILGAALSGSVVLSLLRHATQGAPTRKRTGNQCSEWIPILGALALSFCEIDG